MSINYKGRKIKYIASDLDGTLLFDEGHKLDDETYELISKCIDENVLFIVASGRTYQNELEVMKPIAHRISYIAGNGAHCFHKGKQIVYEYIEKKDAYKVFDLVEQVGNCHMFISCNGKMYTNSKDKEFLRHMNEDVHLFVNPIQNIREIKEDIDKISLFKFNGFEDIQPVFVQELPQMKVVTSGNQWLDFLPLHVNKGNALKKLLKMEGISLEDGIAFGDQENDVEMIRCAGIGYGMKHGAKKLKEASDVLIDSAKNQLKEIVMA